MAKKMTDEDVCLMVCEWPDQYIAEQMAWIRAKLGASNHKHTEGELKAYAQGLRMGWMAAFNQLKLHKFIDI